MDGKKLRRAGFCGLAALLAATVIVCLFIPKEPSYQGLTLSQWLMQGESSEYPDSPEWNAASNAIYQIGTNAIPLLDRWATAKDIRAKSAVISWIDSHTALSLMSATERQYAGRLGFWALKEKSRAASPLFIQWTYDKNAESRRWGLVCLTNSGAGRETLSPVLSRLVHDADPFAQRVAVESLARLDPTTSSQPNK